MFIPSQKDIYCLRQKPKQYFVKLYLKNEKMQTIDELQGELIDGSYTIDCNSDIRRVCNFTFMVKDKNYYVNVQSKIWIDKIVEVHIGTLYIRTNEILWYSLGLCVFNTNGFQYDNVTNNIMVTCLDLMCKLNGTRGGVLRGLATKIPHDSIVTDVIKYTVTQLGGFDKYIINENLNPLYRTIPYDLEFGTGATVYEILKKIADVFGSIEFFFDTDGTFIWRNIPIASTDIIMFDDVMLKELVKSESVHRSFEDISNAIEVWGKDNISERLLLVDKMPENPDSRYNYMVNPDSVYAVKVDDSKPLLDSDFIWSVFSGREYEAIYSKELCLDRCKYEMYLSATLNDTMDLSTIIIPWLVPNMKFEYTHKSDGVKSQYLTQRISFDFTFSNCSISAIKFNPLYSWL